MGTMLRRAAALAVIATLLGTGAAAAEGRVTAVRALLDGRPIPISAVSRYDCHDRAFPLIRCFPTPAALAADEAALQSATPGTATTTAFVRWFADANYGGSYFDAYFNYADLSTIGWNDRISSFYPLNGGHPVWWQDVNYLGVRWDWGTSAVPYVGNGANDQFSSVQAF